MADNSYSVYEWLEELAKYVSNYIRIFVSYQHSKGSILIDIPVLSNIDKPKCLDDFIKQLLGEKRKRLELGWIEQWRYPNKRLSILWNHCPGYG